MSKTYRPYQPTPSFLLPPSPLDWLPEDHLARFVLDTVGELDLSEIFGYYEREERGYPPHHPMMMVAILLYAYCVGVPSSRKLEKRTHEDVAFRVLAGNTHPDHTRISEFRRIDLHALSKLFVQVLRLCQKLGLVKLGHVALDGTKKNQAQSANCGIFSLMAAERRAGRGNGGSSWAGRVCQSGQRVGAGGRWRAFQVDRAAPGWGSFVRLDSGWSLVPSSGTVSNVTVLEDDPLVAVGKDNLLRSSDTVRWSGW